MTKARKVDPGLAQADMSTEEVDLNQLADSIWAAMERAIAAADKNTHANIPDLLRSMRETYDSILAVHEGARLIEEKKDQRTGCWADMLMLARSQLDALFIGLLLAHDSEKWAAQYFRAGWAAEAQHTFYVMRRFASVPSGQDIYNKNVCRMKKLARHAPVTAKEWIATLAGVRGKQLRFGAKECDKIEPFPTPGQAVNLVKSGPYGEIAALLWQEWKFLCDPAHSGLATIARRHAFRNKQVCNIGPRKRKDAIHDEFFSPAVHTSFVAIMTLTTMLAMEHRDNPELMAAVVKGWEVLERGTRVGGIIWDKWARQALGVLPS